MNDRELAAQQPRNIDEALDCMRDTLQRFHAAGDKRAIFLRLYYIMTLEVHAAIHGLGDYHGKQVFLDADWVRALSGKFASLYFKGLDTRGREPDESVERAWKAADTACRSFRSTVVQNALLGINAHINYDLPRAIAANLDPAELNDYPTLQLRKFDHDQVNNLLVRTLRPIQDVLARDYAPGIALIDNLLGDLDERAQRGRAEVLPGAGLVGRARLRLCGEERHRCDRARQAELGVAQGGGVPPHEAGVVDPERVLGLPGALLGTRRWDRITLEPVGGVKVPAANAVNPLT